jgi:flagellar basal-body rod modification protein FlgD
MSSIHALPARLSTQEPGATPNNGTSAGADDPLANKQTFLRLLVAQLQNQNPLDPADPIQYVTQLTQFSVLEQTLGSRTELEAIRNSIDELVQRTEVPPAAGAK